MTKDVIVTIIGTQDEEDIELTTCGTYYYKDGLHYVFYEEQAEPDSPVVKDRLCFDAVTFEMTKKGGVNSQMRFHKDQVTGSYYQTPFGPIDLEIVTKEYSFREEDNYMEMHIDYTLGMNKMDATDCHVCVKVEGKA